MLLASIERLRALPRFLEIAGVALSFANSIWLIVSIRRSRRK
jgi:hypothetical protein